MIFIYNVGTYYLLAGLIELTAHIGTCCDLYEYSHCLYLILYIYIYIYLREAL